MELCDCHTLASGVCRGMPTHVRAALDTSAPQSFPSGTPPPVQSSANPSWRVGHKIWPRVLQSFNHPLLQACKLPSLKLPRLQSPCQDHCDTSTTRNPSWGPKNSSKRRGRGVGVPRKHPRLRRPAWAAEPYGGKPQKATLGPKALLGEASEDQPKSQSLLGGSLRTPTWVPEPY